MKRKPSEIVSQLIVMAFGPVQEDTDVTMTESMELYGKLAAEERREAATVSARPDLSALLPCGKPAPLEGEPREDETDPPKESASRAAAKFKRETLERLKAYREEHGLGCWNVLADKCGATVTPDTLINMVNGSRYGIDVWREVAAALDYGEVNDGKEM